MNPTTLDPKAKILTQAIGKQESGGNYSAKGGSQEYGAFQYTPNTWAAQSQKYLGQAVPLNMATPEQQNKVAYSWVKEKLDRGYTPAQVASMHNAGEGAPDAYKGNVGTNKFGVKYDTAAYVRGVQAHAESLWAQQNKTGNTIPQQQPQDNTSGAWFPSSPNDTQLEAGAKVLGNMIPSAINFGKGILNTLNPLNTINNLAELPGAIKDFANTPGATNQLPGAVFEAVVPKVGQQLLKGDTKGMQESITNDPVGQIAPFLLAAQGVAKGIDWATGAKSGQLGQASKYVEGTAKTMQNIANEGGFTDTHGMIEQIQKNIIRGLPEEPFGKSVTPAMLERISSLDPKGFASISEFTKAADNIIGAKGLLTNAFDTAMTKTADVGKAIASPVTVPIAAAGRGVLGIMKSAASHLTTMPFQDIKTIFTDGKAVKALQDDAAGRGGLANEFGTNVDNVVASSQESGAAYQSFREMKGVVAVPENFITKALDKFGLKLDAKGKIIADTNSVTRNVNDINAIQGFVDNWGNKPTLTPNEFLNMRGDLAELAKYDKMQTGLGKTAKSQIIANSIRQEANSAIRPQIQGLFERDAIHQPLIEQVKQLQKDFLVKDTNGEYVFKDGAINKIFNATGAGKDALLQRMEQVMPGITNRIQIYKAAEAIENAYANKTGAYTRGVLEGGAIITGSVPAIIATIVSNPSIAVPLIRGLGWTAKQVAPVVAGLKLVSGDISSLATKIPVLPATENKQ